MPYHLLRKGNNLPYDQKIRVLDWVQEAFEIAIKGDIIANKNKFNMNFFSDKVCGRKTPGLFTRVKKMNTVDAYKVRRYMKAQYAVFQKVYDHDISIGPNVKYTDKVSSKVDQIQLV